MFSAVFVAFKVFCFYGLNGHSFQPMYSFFVNNLFHFHICLKFAFSSGSSSLAIYYIWSKNEVDRVRIKINKFTIVSETTIYTIHSIKYRKNHCYTILLKEANLWFWKFSNWNWSFSRIFTSTESQHILVTVKCPFSTRVR